MITLALSKGRIFEETLPLLAAAGITTEFLEQRLAEPRLGQRDLRRFGREVPRWCKRDVSAASRACIQANALDGLHDGEASEVAQHRGLGLAALAATAFLGCCGAHLDFRAHVAVADQLRFPRRKRTTASARPRRLGVALVRR